MEVESNDHLKGPLMWRDAPGQHETPDKLPFETGDILNFLQERPLYFTARQVQSWIEHFAHLFKKWIEKLPRTKLYDAMYDICDYSMARMWDTIDTLLQLVAKYSLVTGQAEVGDAFELTAFYADIIGRRSAKYGFLFDIPKDERPAHYDHLYTCRKAAVTLFIVAVVDLRKEGFFSGLIGMVLPEPKSLQRIFIDNEPGHLNWLGTDLDRGRQSSIRPSALVSLLEARKARKKQSSTGNRVTKRTRGR